MSHILGAFRHQLRWLRRAKKKSRRRLRNVRPTVHRPPPGGRIINENCRQIMILRQWTSTEYWQGALIRSCAFLAGPIRAEGDPADPRGKTGPSIYHPASPPFFLPAAARGIHECAPEKNSITRGQSIYFLFSRNKGAFLIVVSNLKEIPADHPMNSEMVQFGL